MKNPFAMMAMMAAAMSAAFRENAYRDAGMALPSVGRGSRGTAGKANPAGTKKILRFYKAKHDTKAESVEEAWAWYRGYMQEADQKARQIEAKRKAAREAVKNPLPLAA